MFSIHSSIYKFWKHISFKGWFCIFYLYLIFQQTSVLSRTVDVTLLPSSPITCYFFYFFHSSLLLLLYGKFCVNYVLKKAAVIKKVIVIFYFCYYNDYCMQLGYTAPVYSQYGGISEDTVQSCFGRSSQDSVGIVSNFQPEWSLIRTVWIHTFFFFVKRIHLIKDRGFSKPLGFVRSQFLCSVSWAAGNILDSEVFACTEFKHVESASGRTSEARVPATFPYTNLTSTG